MRTSGSIPVLPGAAETSSHLLVFWSLNIGVCVMGDLTRGLLLYDPFHHD